MPTNLAVENAAFVALYHFRNLEFFCIVFQLVQPWILSKNATTDKRNKAEFPYFYGNSV
jgi:hypothetical protein